MAARFTIKRNGVPFEVEAADRATAESVLDNAIAERPGILSKKAISLGMDFDFQTNVATERSATDEFLIGAGNTFTDIGHVINDLFSAEELSAREKSKRENEAQAFAFLDEQGLGAEDFGEIAPMAIGGGTAGIRLAAQTLKAAGAAGKKALSIGSGLGLVGAALRSFVKHGSKQQLDDMVLAQAARSGPGQAAIRNLANGNIKSPKAVEKLVETIAKEGFRPGANMRVRDAQVKIQRALREQE